MSQTATARPKYKTLQVAKLRRSRMHGRRKLPAGTRLRVMSLPEPGRVKVKVEDKTLGLLSGEVKFVVPESLLRPTHPGRPRINS